jgi:hypothetical protein
MTEIINNLTEHKWFLVKTVQNSKKW